MTRYVYDQEDILFEFDENDRIKARYTHGPGIDEPVSVDRDTDADGTLDITYYYHYDGLGSVVAMTDSAGNVVQTYVYDTFGNIVQQSGNVENVYAYTGREWDAEAGLYYYRARYYDPTLGRFINGDPIGFAGGDVNFYVYVQNNPVNWVDPLGLVQFEVFGNTIDIRFSGTFLGFNLSWDMTGFSKNNFRTNVVFPPISFGGGFDFKINPPNECDDRKWISPFAGRRHMSIGTNVTYDENTGSLEYKGFNFSIGSSFGVPFGVTTPLKN